MGIVVKIDHYVQKEKRGDEFWRRRLYALARDDRCLVDLRGGRRVNCRRGRGQLHPARHRWRRGGQVLEHELRRQAHLAAPAANAEAGYDRRNDDRRSTVQDEYELIEWMPLTAATAATAADVPIGVVLPLVTRRRDLLVRDGNCAARKQTRVIPKLDRNVTARADRLFP